MTKHGKPTELHTFEIDGVLYDSQPPTEAPSSWLLSAHSLAGHGQPGFDTKWILEGVVQARRSILNPSVVTVLLTGRPLHVEMDKAVRTLLRLADLRFDHVQLKPVSLPVPTPTYKVLSIQQWLLEYPTILGITFFDPDPESVQLVKEVAGRAGRTCVAPQVSSSSPSPG